MLAGAAVTWAAGPLCAVLAAHAGPRSSSRAGRGKRQRWLRRALGKDHHLHRVVRPRVGLGRHAGCAASG
ncbi:hypothetical protein M885DRAFT_533335, partial [Pelagophyceae sp. CCMP2097]